MIFSSIEFILWFLPIFFFLYAVTPGQYRNLTLLAGSLVFYAYGDPRHLVLLMVSVLFNYLLGLHLGSPKGKRKNHRHSKFYKKRRMLMGIAVIGNVGAVLLYKVFLRSEPMPLGISFYTFQILSYLIDVYQGEVGRETSFVKLATYITMFPQLIEGPIVRYGEVEDALGKRQLTPEGIQDGLKVFVLGLSAKVLLADRIGLLWHSVQVIGFESISTPLAWLGAISYSLKLYFDFYGYSLMAKGLGRMIGFELPDNFDTPYMACTVRSFYRRWHTTLGRWFCRYVYVPLGGNRRGELRTVLNLLAVWALTALWHGVTPNFLIWGMLLWLLIVLERQVGRPLQGHPLNNAFLRRLLHGLGHLYLWAVIPVTWMCFEVTDIGQMQIYLGRMFGVGTGLYTRAGDWMDALRDYGALLAAGLFCATSLPGRIYRRWKKNILGIVVLAFLLWLCVWRLMVEGGNPFMYRNF